MFCSGRSCEVEVKEQIKWHVQDSRRISSAENLPQMNIKNKKKWCKNGLQPN
jgi:hypothetical protein